MSGFKAKKANYFKRESRRRDAAAAAGSPFYPSSRNSRSSQFNFSAGCIKKQAVKRNLAGSDEDMPRLQHMSNASFILSSLTQFIIDDNDEENTVPAKE